MHYLGQERTKEGHVGREETNKATRGRGARRERRRGSVGEEIIEGVDNTVKDGGREAKEVGVREGTDGARWGVRGLDERGWEGCTRR